MYVLTVKNKTFCFESYDEAYDFFEEGITNGEWEDKDYMGIELDNDMF